MPELVALRRSRGLSQKELADLAKVSPATVYEMEAGKRPQPRGSTLRKLAKALSVDVAELAEDFYAPKASGLLSAERALKMTSEAFNAELQGAETSQLHKLLSQLVGDDLPQTRADVKGGAEDAISQRAFSLALEVRAELVERGEHAPEDRLPVFKRRLQALHLVPDAQETTSRKAESVASTGLVRRRDG